VSAHARFISFDLKPPPAESWNGILGGYVLSYKSHEFDETLKRTIDDPTEEVCLLILRVIATVTRLFVAGLPQCGGQV